MESGYFSRLTESHRWCKMPTVRRNTIPNVVVVVSYVLFGVFLDNTDGLGCHNVGLKGVRYRFLNRSEPTESFL